MAADGSTLERRYVRLGSLRLAYLEHGRAAPQAPSLVLLHGLIAEGETFRRLINRLPADMHIVVIDLPGAGYSDRPLEDEVGFAGMALILRETLSRMGLRRPVLLGHSHGAVVAMRLAADYPELLTALILLSPAHPFSTAGNQLIRFYLSPPGRLFAHCLPILPWQFHLFAFKRMPGRGSVFGRQEIQPYLHTLRTPGTVHHLLRLIRTWIADMTLLAQKLQEGSIDLPTLFLWGERDIVVPLSTSTQLLHHFSRATLVPLPGVGHLPNEEDPDACANAIGSFLSRLSR